MKFGFDERVVLTPHMAQLSLQGQRRPSGFGKPIYISHHAADCAQVDPGTNGGRGGLSQLSGVTLLSPPVIAHCEKLARNMECPLRAPDLPQS